MHDIVYIVLGVWFSQFPPALDIPQGTDILLNGPFKSYSIYTIYEKDEPVDVHLFCAVADDMYHWVTQDRIAGHSIPPGATRCKILATDPTAVGYSICGCAEYGECHCNINVEK